MNDASKEDFGGGVAVARLADGAMLAGQIGGEEVLIARRGGEFFAVGPSCPHYGGPLGAGLLIGHELRCPLHHAAFDLRSGEAMRAPAIDPIPCWRVERVGDRIFLREKRPAPQRAGGGAGPGLPRSIVIVGGGAAGLAAAEMLRREGYDGRLTMLSADDAPPCDRPNLSKEFLAGSAPEEWMPLRPPAFYTEREINLVLNAPVAALDLRDKQVRLATGKSYAFDALLLATGADPVRLPLPGAADADLLYLRSFADGRALRQRAGAAKQVVIVGASFIALEVAASLRERGVAVHVVAPEKLPLERVFGADVGHFVQGLHEAHGVQFHLGQSVAGFAGRQAVLSGGARLAADFLVLGVGVRPALALAEQAGLKTDRGVLVDPYLQTSAPGVYAAGDIARWPDPHSGEALRIEHWVVAERQGQVAARNMLGQRARFDAVPFFWTAQYGLSLRYAGHAETWDSLEIDGSLEARDCAIRYKRGGRLLAVATLGRDLESLRAEAALESSSPGER